MKFRKLIAGLAVICAICYSGTALAAGPEETAETATQETTRTMAVSVEDITAVLEQLTEYEEEVEMLAQLVYAEARGVGSKAEQAAVVWCVLNRADAGYSDGSIAEVVDARSQFAYSSRLPVDEECFSIAQDVMIRWLLEKRGITEVGRVLPSDYLYFAGRGGRNWFRKTYRSDDYWDWSLPDPYDETTAVIKPAD